MLIDTHTHYDDEKFNEDRYETIERVHKEGISYILNPSSCMSSIIESIALSEKYEYVYSAVGIHPHNCGKMNTYIMSALADFASNSKVVAIGEIGLDYYYDNSPRDVQKHWFALQINLAVQMGLPIIVHDREAHEDVMKTMKKEKAHLTGGVLHAFSGSVEMAKEVIDMGFYISLGGVVTFKNAKRVINVAKYIPDDRLLLETDSPYLSPEPKRGKRNDSSNLIYVLNKLAEIRGTDPEELARITSDNAIRLFGFGGAH